MQTIEAILSDNDISTMVKQFNASVQKSGLTLLGYHGITKEWKGGFPRSLSFIFNFFILSAANIEMNSYDKREYKISHGFVRGSNNLYTSENFFKPTEFDFTCNQSVYRNEFDLSDNFGLTITSDMNEIRRLSQKQKSFSSHIGNELIDQYIQFLGNK